MLENEYGYFHMSAEMQVLPKLMMLKVDMLNMQGYNLMPFDVGSKGFLKQNLLTPFTLDHQKPDN
jgi:hypothetical protein